MCIGQFALLFYIFVPLCFFVNEIDWKIMMKYILFLFLICCLAGCNSILLQKRKVRYIPEPKNLSSQFQHSSTKKNAPGHFSVKEKLLSQYNEWKGTRYREGGLSKRGVDCSGFVQITFRSKLGVDVPRLTEQQVKVGQSVARSNLRPGDLIFFKTGFFSRHVGIYVGGTRFLHASSAKGVTISSLKEEYWADSYWLAKRIVM